MNEPASWLPRSTDRVRFQDSTAVEIGQSVLENTHGGRKRVKAREKTTFHLGDGWIEEQLARVMQ
jgi:hypothetical protein